MKQKRTIKLNESQLRQMICEALQERKPADRQVGPHTFKGTSYDKNGNPRYTCDTVPDEFKKTMGWRMTKKHGLHGQIGDPSKVPGVTNESKLRDIIRESIKKVLKENGEYAAQTSLMDKVHKCVRVNLAAEIGGNHHEVMRGENNSILVINRDNPKDGVKISFGYIQGGLNESKFQKPDNWKETEFLGTYQDEDGAIYMPDDDNDIIDIFTLDIFDIENENSIDDMQYAYDYESEDEAIQAAREIVQKYADYDSVINVFVMAGEYKDERTGDVYGEPNAIYCVSNKDKQTTMMARKNAGYTNPEADEYIGN